MVHMLGVARAHQRKGLGRMLVLLILQRLKKRGFSEVLVGTLSYRLGAIRLYLGLGFTPVYRHITHFFRWKKVLTKIRTDQ